MTSWSSSKWGVANNLYHSSPGSITDSPGGNYTSYSNYSVTTINKIDLKDSPVAVLNYWARWNLEKGFDYVQILISDDNGLTWTPQQGLYTRAGTEYETPGEPVYDGNKFSWVKEQIVLTNYVNKDIRIRFTIRTDAQVNKDGFYFDDYTVTILDMTGVGVKEKTPVLCWLSDPMPNPANADVTFTYKLPSQEEAEIILTDIQGKTIRQVKIEQLSGRISFSVEHLSPGIYFCRLQSINGGSSVKKLMVY
jgi:hypothetical protein